MAKETRHAFLHVPKAGGTTLYDAIRTMNPLRKVVTLGGNRQIGGDDEEFSERVKKALSESGYPIRENHFPSPRVIFRSHDLFGLHNVLPDTKYFTFLRDPVDRVRSVYSYVKQSSQHPLNKAASEQSLLDFLESHPHLCNQQSQIMLPRSQRPNVPVESRAEVALEQIDKHFSFVGVLEEFDASVLLLSSVLGAKLYPLYVVQNTSQRPEADPAERAALAELNAQDGILYNECKKRLDQEIANRGASFEKQILRFQRINKLARGPLRTMFWFARGRGA